MSSKTKPKSIGIVLTGISEATNDYRFFPWGYLGRIAEDFGVVFYPHFDRVPSDLDNRHSVVVIDRPIHPRALDLINRLRGRVHVVAEFDDDFLSIPWGQPQYLYFQQPEVRRMIVECMKAVDEVFVTTPALAEVVAQYNSRVSIFPNCWNDYRDELGPVAPDPLPGQAHKITWRGGDSHGPDLYEVRRTLRWAMQQPGLDMYFFGIAPVFLPREHFKGMPILPLEQYREMMSRHQTHYLLTPLLDCLYNRCKSNIAWIEATINGAVSIAPALPEFCQPGILNYTSEQELRRALISIADGEIPYLDRVRNVEGSRESLARNFRLSSWNKTRIQWFEDRTGLRFRRKG